MRSTSRAGRRLAAVVACCTLAAGASSLAGCAAAPAATPLALPAQTPLAAAGHARLTTHEELLEFMRVLGEASPRVETALLGTSVEGREIPYLKISTGCFGAERDARTLVLIYAEQHGTEPSGREAALELALALARGDHDDWLATMDVLLVPQLNPDGGVRGERRNAADVDLNRAHLVLDAPEVIALRELFHRWEPEVAVDLHEYLPWSEAWLERGWLRRWDLQIGLPTNLNIDPALRRLAEERFLPQAIAALEADGFTAHNYIVGTPERVRWSTTDIDDGRHGFGILQTFSLIYEGRRELEPAGRIAHRAAAQRRGVEVLLAFTAEHGTEIRGTVREARRRVAEGERESLHLQMGRAPGAGPLVIPVDRVVQRAGEWQIEDTVEVSIEGFLPTVTSELEAPLPEAYLLPAAARELIALLRAHQVELEVLRGGERFDVEVLEIAGFVSRELEAEIELAEVVAQRRRHIAEPGDVLVPTAQLRGLMVATALEPASMHALLHHPAFAALRVPGRYPVLRAQGRLPAGGPEYDQGRDDLQWVLARIVEWLPGEWSAFPHVHHNRTVRMPEGGMHEDWHRSVTLIDAPRIGGAAVLYAQVNIGGRDGPLLPRSQHLYKLWIDEARGAVVITGQGPRDPERFVDLGQRPELWAEVELRDESQVRCDFLWRRSGDQVVGVLEGRTRERRRYGPGTCAYFSEAAQAEFFADAEWVLSPESWWYHDVNTMDGRLFVGRADRTHTRYARMRPYLCEIEDASGRRRLEAHDRGFQTALTLADGTVQRLMLLRSEFPDAREGRRDRLRLQVMAAYPSPVAAESDAPPGAAEVVLRWRGTTSVCTLQPQFPPIRRDRP